MPSTTEPRASCETLAISIESRQLTMLAADRRPKRHASIEEKRFPRDDRVDLIQGLPLAFAVGRDPCSLLPADEATEYRATALATPTGTAGAFDDHRGGELGEKTQCPLRHSMSWTPSPRFGDDFITCTSVDDKTCARDRFARGFSWFHRSRNKSVTLGEMMRKPM